MKKKRVSFGILVLSLLLTCSGVSSAADTIWTNINGTVSYKSIPVCTMVLANGQYMFTCSGDGSFNLNVPVDGNGQIRIFVFCSGLAPYEQLIYPAQGQNMQIALEQASPGRSMNVAVTLRAISTTRARLTGTVSYGGVPLCAMVLANGQYMFTCSGDGSFSLDVPLDQTGAVTLHAFCSCWPPYTYVFTNDQISFVDDYDNDGYSIAQGDCDDINAGTHPGATEISGDGIDQDCVGHDSPCRAMGPLSGTWESFFTPNGETEQGPFQFGILQEGGGLMVCLDGAYQGSVSGVNVFIDLLWTQLVGTIEGDYSMGGIYSGGTWRALKLSADSSCCDASFWDIDVNGIPKFVTNNHIELSKIASVSRFRSAVGHSYTDGFEHCRSMKHYYGPYGGLDWSKIKIFSPVDGIITKIELESHPNSGWQVHIKSAEYPAFKFIIFHVNLDAAFSVGDTVSAGQQIGTHIGNVTADDIAVGVSTKNGYRLVSYFSVMTDTLFQAYKNRGVQTRDACIISKEARDADPATCAGETFVTTGNISNWVNLY